MRNQYRIGMSPEAKLPSPLHEVYYAFIPTCVQDHVIPLKYARNVSLGTGQGFDRVDSAMCAVWLRASAFSILSLTAYQYE